jgi:hypothetical protein
MQTGLAEAWWSRVCDEAEESAERLVAAHTLAVARGSDGQYAEAERINREVLAVRRRVLGEEHPGTLLSAHNLALSLCTESAGKGSTLGRSGSTGRCLVWRGEYWARSIRTL